MELTIEVKVSSLNKCFGHSGKVLNFKMVADTYVYQLFISSVDKHLFYIFNKDTAKLYYKCLLKRIPFEMIRFSKSLGLVQYIGLQFQNIYFCSNCYKLKSM